MNNNKRLWTIADGLDPDTQIVKLPIIEVSLDKFLSLPIIQVNKNKYSIKDIVLFFANNMGGIHRGNLNDYQKALTHYFGLHIGTTSAVFYQLKAIARVVVKSLDPLVQKINP